MRRCTLHVALLFLSIFQVTFADGPADNKVESVRPIPPPGVSISPEDRSVLQKELQELNGLIAKVRSLNDPSIKKYLPDVEIFSRAVELALNEDGFFEPADVGRAMELLREGRSRANAMLQSPGDWRWKLFVDGKSTIVRGFRSKLDGTVQPYGVVASGGSPSSKQRGDVWCRGRSEKGLELQFIAARMTNPDPAPATGVIMIHPFGRYCNANKLAGEVDTLEAIEHALSEYPIDAERVSIRGFSMGGAAAWHLAVHYPDRWFAANPGAGFSETPLFLNVFQSESLKPYWFEEKLWQMYDCPLWARNLRMLPTIAYSGEIDKQKQAADVMAKACWELPGGDQFELTHIVAPRTAHQVSPESRKEIESRLATLDRLRNQTVEGNKHSFAFTTNTLKYNRAYWLTVDALEEHWKSTVVEANFVDNTVWLDVSNVTALTLDIPADVLPPGAIQSGLNVIINRASDSQPPVFNRPLSSDRSFRMRLRKASTGWIAVDPLQSPDGKLHKRHDLQGPIDDAFMAPFLFVKPSTKGFHEKVDQWVDTEMQRAIREWHRQMRGDVRIKSSEDLTPDDIEKYHLVLWGDPKSNPTLGKIAEKLPIGWNEGEIQVLDRKVDAKSHAPVMIYPNPLNPTKYVVLNSSFTYREYDYLNNARQVPKLPDWAIIDLSVPPNARWPGRVVLADFFDEDKSLKPKIRDAE